MTQQDEADEAREPSATWRQLPPRPAPEELVESQETEPARGAPPEAGDPDTNWMIRHAG